MIFPEPEGLLAVEDFCSTFILAMVISDVYKIMCIYMEHFPLTEAKRTSIFPFLVNIPPRSLWSTATRFAL